MAFHRLESRHAVRRKGADAHSAGRTGKGFPTSRKTHTKSHPILASQGIGGQESNGEPREANAWRRSRPMGYARQEMECDRLSEPQRVSGSPPKAGLYPEGQRKGTPLGHTDYERQSDASTLSACAGTGCGMCVR